jgi:hypothetical protein
MKLFLLIPFLLAAASCSKPIKNKAIHCDHFWTGTFYNEKNKIINTKIKRAKDYQIEEYFPTGAVCKFKIEWLDSCSYKLTPVSGNEACSDSTTPVIVTILETKENSCRIEAQAEGSTFKYKSELFKGG